MDQSNRYTANTHVKSTHSLFKTICLLSLTVSMMVITTACSTDSDMNEVQNQITAIGITPDSIAISEGESREFSAFGLTASGDTVRDANFNWWSTLTPMFLRLETTGLSPGRTPGVLFV